MLLWAYKVKGDVAGAERTFEELRGEHGLEPDPITYHALLALYSQVGTPRGGRARGRGEGGTRDLLTSAVQLCMDDCVSILFSV